MDILHKLQNSGLSKREAHIYLALLQKQEFTAAEIAAIVPVGRTKVYEIIPVLISKGLCTESQRDNKKIYRAVEPSIALDNLFSFFQQEIENEIEQKKDTLHRKKKSFDELAKDLNKVFSKSIHKPSNLEYIEVLKDISQIRNKWIELQKNTRCELLAFNKAPYSIKHSKNAQYQEELLKRSEITEKGIFEYGSCKTKEDLEVFIEVVSMYANLGEDCRVIKHLPIKLVVIDEKITMLALNDPVSMKPSITTLIVDHPSFALAQKEVFNSYWKKAVPLKKFIQNKK
jgi:HTH-type transcriptional regulator, sugar sensing transcriptional regulator